MKIKKTESSLNLRKPLWSVVSALAVVALLGVMLPAFAQQPYETAPVISASKILPPELLSGPNHRVQERVKNDGIVNIYTIDSRFGSFTAVSTAMLRKGKWGQRAFSIAISDCFLSRLRASPSKRMQE